VIGTPGSRACSHGTSQRILASPLAACPSATSAFGRPRRRASRVLAHLPLARLAGEQPVDPVAVQGAAGDRLGLEKAMRDYAAWLRRDYAVEPEDETLAPFDTLRRGTGVVVDPSSAAATAD
jgi:hypothetical protein